MAENINEMITPHKEIQYGDQQSRAARYIDLHL